MSHIVRDVGLLVALLLTFAVLIALPVYKRTEVSWLRFFAAGPMTVLSPSRYLRPGGDKVIPILVVLVLVLFAVVWIASWFADNP